MTRCVTRADRSSRQAKASGMSSFSPGYRSCWPTFVPKACIRRLFPPGNPSVQEEKIGFLGLRALVDAVLICERPEEKLTLFQQCLRDFDARPEETLVVGDRIDREISFGKQLGCVTAWALQGRHSRKLPSGEGERVDFVLHHITELRERLAH